MEAKNCDFLERKNTTLSYAGQKPTKEETLANDASMKQVSSGTTGLVKKFELGAAASSEASPRPQAQADSKRRDGSTTKELKLRIREQAVLSVVAEVHTAGKKRSADNDESQSPLPLAKRPRSTWVDTLVGSYDKLASEEARSMFLEKWAGGYCKRHQRRQKCTRSG